MKTTYLKKLTAVMIFLFVVCIGSFALASNGSPTGDPILQLSDPCLTATFDPGAENLVINDITEILCQQIEVEFIGIEIDASSAQGEIVLGLYENGILLESSSPLDVQGGANELVGFNPSNALDLNASNTYSLGVVYSSPGAIFFRATNAPMHMGVIEFETIETAVEFGASYPTMPTNLNPSTVNAYNLGFYMSGSINSTNTQATLAVNACGSYLSPSGMETYTSSGMYTDVIPNAAGCDSIITLNVTIPPPIETVLSINACEEYTWAENGITYSSTGVYSVNYPSASGCDSIVTLDLNVTYPTMNIVDVESCGPYYWPESEATYNTTGTYFLTRAVDGEPCLEYLQLNLVVDPVNEVSQSEVACGSFVWPVNGVAYTQSGIYTDYLPSVSGCDTMVTLDLIVTAPIQTTDVISTCDSSYTWVNGITYTANNNTATAMYQSVGGCDSIVTLNLSFYDVQYATETVVSCGPYTWLDGVTYNETPTGTMPSITTSNSLGCDQTTFLNLTILQPTTSVDNVLACGSYTWIDGNTYTSSNNTATFTLTNAAGCDSTITLNLIMVALDNSVTVSGLILASNEPNATYQWYQESNGLQLIPGATNQNFVAPGGGIYVVEITQGSCSELSEAVVAGTASLDEENLSSVIVAPNPSNGQFKISGDWETAELYDITGRTIQIQVNPDSQQVTIGNIATGKYVIAVTMSNGKTVMKDVLIY